jgi:hypothetical protein
MMFLRLSLLCYSLLLSLVVVNAELSETCTAEMVDIQNDNQVALEMSLLDGVIATIPSESFCTVTETSQTCIYEYEDFVVPELETACNDASGQYIEMDRDLTCENNDGLTLSYQYFNVPECVGVSCEPDELDDHVDEAWAASKASYEAQGYTCTSSASVFDNDGDQLDASMRNGVSSTLLLLSMTLAWFGFA